MSSLRNMIVSNPNIIIAVVASMFLLIVTVGTFFITRSIYQKTEPVPIVTVPNTTPNTLKQEIPELSKSDAQDLSRQIQRTVEQQAPQYHYYTYTQKAADTQAQQYASEQKADKIVKETQYVPIYVNGQEKDKELVEEKKPNENLERYEKEKDNQVIENNYYAINLNRKHSVEVGAKYVHDTTYAAVSYRNRDVRYEVMYAPGKDRWGAGIMVTVAKW